MEIRIESGCDAGSALRVAAERRLRFVVRRLAWWVSRGTVRISGDDPPLPARRCRVELETHAGETIVVTAIAQDGPAALDSALSRAGRALARAWARALDGEARRISGRPPQPALVHARDMKADQRSAARKQPARAPQNEGVRREGGVAHA